MMHKEAHEKQRIHCLAAGKDGFLYSGGEDKVRCLNPGALVHERAWLRWRGKRCSGALLSNPHAFPRLPAVWGEAAGAFPGWRTLFWQHSRPSRRSDACLLIVSAGSKVPWGDHRGILQAAARLLLDQPPSQQAGSRHSTPARLTPRPRMPTSAVRLRTDAL